MKVLNRNFEDLTGEEKNLLALTEFKRRKKASIYSYIKRKAIKKVCLYYYEEYLKKLAEVKKERISRIPEYELGQLTPKQRNRMYHTIRLVAQYSIARKYRTEFQEALSEYGRI